MSGDWIKMRTGLLNHPKVVRISSALKADRFRVVGALFALWSVFDEHSEDGVLDGYDFESMDSEIGWGGFCGAVSSVGWLKQDGQSLVAIDFLEHNGKTAKRRASETKRKQIVRKVSAKCPHEEQTKSGLEKRREDKETTPAVLTDTTASLRPEAGAVLQEPKPPETVFQQAVEELRVGVGVGTDMHERAGALAAVLAANSVKGTAVHPQVVEWARSGISQETLRKAIAEARKSNSGPLNASYLAPIVERVLQGKPNGKASAWASDEKACEAKAKELGLWPARGGESWDELRGRIRAKLSRMAEESVR